MKYKKKILSTYFFSILNFTRAVDKHDTLQLFLIKITFLLADFKYNTMNERLLLNTFVQSNDMTVLTGIRTYIKIMNNLFNPKRKYR